MTIIITLFIVFINSKGVLLSQRTYGTSGGELIFSHAFMEQNGQSVAVRPRITAFVHFGQYKHYDFNNNIGLYSGLTLRNVGFYTKQDDIKIKRRAYMLGVPLAFKAGNFKNNFYIYAGGEYDFAFHYKHKVINNGSKYTGWLSERSNKFLPSVFGGLQFAKGYNIKFKYYLKDFLNKGFIGPENGEEVDFSTFNRSQIFYLSLEFHINTKAIKKRALEDKTYVVDL